MIAVRFIRRIGGSIVARVLDVPVIPERETLLEFGAVSVRVESLSMRPVDPVFTPGVTDAVLVTVFTAPEMVDQLQKALADGWQAVG